MVTSDIPTTREGGESPKDGGDRGQPPKNDRGGNDGAGRKEREGLGKGDSGRDGNESRRYGEGTSLGKGDSGRDGNESRKYGEGTSLGGGGGGGGGGHMGVDESVNNALHSMEKQAKANAEEEKRRKAKSEA